VKKPSGSFFIRNIILIGMVVFTLSVLAFLVINPLQKPVPPLPEAARATATIPPTRPATQPATTFPPVPPGLPITTANLSATPTPTLAATFTPALAPSQPAGEPGLTVISPTVAVGELIPVPWVGEAESQVYRAAGPPLMSLQEARTLVLKIGMSWALGGYFEGKRITLTAVYGLVTLGTPNTGGNKQGWLGPQNFNLPTCDAQGNCVPTGTILPQVIKRPMWILNYGNTTFTALGPACMTTPCPTEQIFTNSVYIIDAQTRAIFDASFYTKR
jgi:hypothetical protein